MREVKLIELRDSATFIPAIAISMEVKGDEDDYLLKRAGYGRGIRCILLTRLDGLGRAHYDPYDWQDRTWHVAHKHLIKEWDSIPNNAVIDVEFLLGETTTAKASERVEHP